jgi:hypothetical protein
MMPGVKYFMWGYQSHFQHLAQGIAKSALQQLDARFDPILFLVGFLTDDRQAHKVCVEPGDCRYPPEVFSGCIARAKAIQSTDSDRNISHTHPLAQKWHLERIEKRALAQAVTETIDGNSESNGLTTFSGWPMLIDGYNVLPVLQVQEDVYKSCYRLRNQQRGEFRVQRSLVDATIDQLAAAFFEQLRLRDAGAGGMHINVHSLTREAAQNLMHTPALAANEPLGVSLFDACEAVSSLKYEGQSGTGQIIVADIAQSDVRLDIEFIDSVDIDDYGAVRKLLQLVTPPFGLITDGCKVQGIGIVKDNYNPAKEDIFVIRFKRDFTWELLHAGQVLLHVRLRRPTLKATGFDRDAFLQTLYRRLPTTSHQTARYLADLASSVASQSHGALFVVSAEAAEEAARLSKQATRVVPFKLTEANVPEVTSIDGAVLVDMEGHCHAIGVILDGLASERCSSSRGARFNSAVRYVESRPLSIALVKSEDGNVDILPSWIPPLSRALIEQHLETARQLASQSSVTIEQHNGTFDWFDDHRFYLLPAICNEVNQLMETVNGKITEAGFLQRILPFKPNSYMNESLLS